MGNDRTIDARRLSTRARSAGESHGVNADALRSVLLTPNVLGQDGVSLLSREIVRALPRPAAVISLHDPDGLPAGADDVEMHGAGGARGTFLAAAAAVSLRCSPATDIVCSHLHLAPAAVLQAWRGARVTAVLCGVEAWVPLRKPEAWALERADLVAISQHTVTRFKSANPAFASTDVTVCHPGLPDLPGPPALPGPTRPDPPYPARPTCRTRPPALIVARMSADERYKGHDELLDVWPALLARKPDARLIVAGDGTNRQRLEQRTASLGLSHAVTFVGRVGDDELAALYEPVPLPGHAQPRRGVRPRVPRGDARGEGVRRRKRRGRRESSATT